MIHGFLTEWSSRFRKDGSAQLILLLAELVRTIEFPLADKFMRHKQIPESERIKITLQGLSISFFEPTIPLCALLQHLKGD
jgi:hypothetical protein